MSRTDRKLSDHFLLAETRVSSPARPQEPDDFVVEHDSTLLLPDDDEPDGRPVAKLHWARVALGAASNAGVSTFDVLDAKSADLCAMYEALFDPATDELKAPFENDLTQDIVYFETFELLDPNLNEQEAAEHLLEHVLEIYGGQALATFFRADWDSLRFVAALRARGFFAVNNKTGAPLYAVPLTRRRSAPD